MTLRFSILDCLPRAVYVANDDHVNAFYGELGGDFASGLDNCLNQEMVAGRQP